jgi:cytoskeleton protein RodZ
MAADRTPGDFGSRLRDARERRGMSLRHIANTTKITVAALDALERNDISRLPGGIFSRAFVRSYAIEVGLDPEEAIRDFIAQFPNDAVAGRLPARHAEEGGNPGSPGNAGSPGSAGNPGNQYEAVSTRHIAPAFLAVTLSVLVAGAALYFATAGRGAAAPVVAAGIDFVAKGYDHVRGFLQGDQRAADAGVPSPPPAVTAPVPVSTPVGSTPAGVARPAGATDNNAKNGRNAGSTRSSTLARNAVSTDAAKAADTTTPDAGPRPPDGPGSASAVPPANTASVEPLTVVLFARRPCWVSATSDGRKAIDRLLQAGERRTLEVRGDLVMTAGDASAITMTLNGAEAKPFGKPGEVVTVRLNPANFREYLPGR